MKAKALGYIVEAAKNKDNTFWTQPKDPLMIEVLKLKDKSNIYHEAIFSHVLKEIDESFLIPMEREFIQNYGDDNFE